MQAIQIKDLLEAGVHLGHQKKKWNPKMQEYIYGDDKDGSCIINLGKTSDLLEKACGFLKEAAARKKNIVFVGTKRHISEIIKEEAIRCGAFYINRRWLGGLLTNFDTIRHRINRLREFEEMQEAGTLNLANKKEASVLNKEFDKLQKTLGGIKNMRGKTDILFVIDQQKENIAIEEAKKMGLTIVAMIDTNCDPTGIEYPIPGNDDSIRSVKYITRVIADAIIEGYNGQVPDVHKSATSRNGFARGNIRQPIRLVQEVAVPKEVEVQ